jgi:hypothetical protein
MTLSSVLELSTYYYCNQLVSEGFMSATNYLNDVFERPSLTFVKYFPNTSFLLHVA